MGTLTRVSQTRTGPLVGVTTSEVRRAERTQPLPEGEPPQHEMALGMPYVRALARAGAIPIVLPPLPIEAVPGLLAPLRGVCLSGGPDLAPSAYGAAPSPDLGPVEPELDASGLGLRLRYLAGGMSATSRTHGRRVLPERSGYYLGWRMVEAHLAERGLPATVRASAADCRQADERALGMRTA